MTAESPQVLALRERYQQSLITKSKELGELLKLISDAEQKTSWQLSDADANSLGEYLHKLAGSAGMYGYADVAQLARSAMVDNQQANMATLVTRLNDLRCLLEQHA